MLMRNEKIAWNDEKKKTTKAHMASYLEQTVVLQTRFFSRTAGAKGGKAAVVIFKDFP